MESIYYILIGIAIGWITKVPFLIKWYREFNTYKVRKVELYNRLMAEFIKLPSDEKNKFYITIEYFKATK